jgi:hypothetical protein
MAYTDYLNTVQKVYIGYYQRPADPGGLIYWEAKLEARGGNLNEIVENFANSAESQALYGTIDSSTIGTVVDRIYMALFNHLDAAGKAYYVAGFNAHTFTAATIMLNILNGAQNEDRLAVENKLAAANLFTRTLDPELDVRDIQATYSGDADAAAARTWLTGVIWNPVTIPTQSETTTFIQNSIANLGDPILGASSGQIFTLTNDTDVATANVFNAGQVYSPGGNDRINSLQDEDVLTGTGANPTLNAIIGNANDNGSVIITPTLTGIQTANLTFTNTIGMAVDLQDATGLTTVNVDRPPLARLCATCLVRPPR